MRPKDNTGRDPAGRRRVVVGLCTAGLIAGGLGSGLVGAGAQETTTTTPPPTTTTPPPVTTTTPPVTTLPGLPPSQEPAEPQADQPAPAPAPAAPAPANPAEPAPGPSLLEVPGSPLASPHDVLQNGALTGPVDSPEIAAEDARCLVNAPPAESASERARAARRGRRSSRARSAAQRARRAAAARRRSDPSTREARRRAAARARAKRAREARARAAAEDCEASEGRRRGARRNGSEPGDGGTRDTAPERALRNANGLPTVANPTTSLALPGAAPIGVPNFFIEKFRIPPFLLPIYQAAGIQYGVRWEILAAINEIETDYGRNLNVSSAGALGWMQFIPSSWRAYGVDANGDRRKDPYNPVDAIFAAARYLKAAGAETDLRKAIFAYNHADWYVDSVLLRARLIGGLPADLLGSLSGLTQGHFPVPEQARYADDLSEREARRRVARGENAARPVEPNASRRGINVYADPGSPVIAVQDGRIVKVGNTRRLGRFVQLRDVYGNTYTYAHLERTARLVPVPKERTQSSVSIARELSLPAADAEPAAAASAGAARPDDGPQEDEAAETPALAEGALAPIAGSALDAFATVPTEPAEPTAAREPEAGAPAPQAEPEPEPQPDAQAAAGAAEAPAVAPEPESEFAPATAAPLAKERLFAHPARRRTLDNGGRDQLLASDRTLAAYFRGGYELNREDVELKRLTPGRRVIAGTVLGRIGNVYEGVAAHTLFEIRPAGRGAPRVDPKPILDGWKLLESTSIYRAQGQNPLAGGASAVSIGRILLMSKEELQERVLANPRVELYSCGRQDIEAGVIDRRVLAALEFLAASGLEPTVTSLRCGHGYYTAGGSVSHHSSGNAVDIAKINGVPIIGNQGAGSITDLTVRRLLTLQGTLRPAQIISLMRYDDAENTLALADHADHIHLGFRPEIDPTTAEGRQLQSVLRPSQWIKLIDRLGQIDNPTVSVRPSKYAIGPSAPPRASGAHGGE